MKPIRVARVSEAIREVAATTILFELKDPRVKNVTVTRVEASADLMTAKVYVSILGSEKAQKLTMHGLEAATGFIQKKLADRLAMRFTPTLTFVLDEGVKRSLEIAKILADENALRGETASTEEVAESDEDSEDDEIDHR